MFSLFNSIISSVKRERKEKKKERKKRKEDTLHAVLSRTKLFCQSTLAMKVEQRAYCQLTARLQCLPITAISLYSQSDSQCTRSYWFTSSPAILADAK